MRSDIKKNLFYNSIYEILVIILPIFTSPYVSRVLGPELLGTYSYTTSIAYYFQMFAMLGIKFYGNRAIAQNRDNPARLNAVFNEIFTLHLMVSLLVVSVYGIYCILFSEYKVYTVIQSMVVFAALFDVSWLFFGLEKFKLTVTRNVIIKLLSVLLIFIFVNDKSDFWIYVVIMAGSQMVSQILLLFMASKYVCFAKPKLSNILKHLKPLMVLFLPVLSLGIFKYTDKIMLGMFGMQTELGYYENAERIINIPLGVVFSFGAVMLPRISSLANHDNSKQIERYMSLSIKYMGGLSLAMAAGLIGIANVFAPVFWGAEFKMSGVLIQILALSIPASTLANIMRNQDMIPHGKDKEYAISVFIGAVVNIFLNLLLIRRFKSIGVSLATVCAEFTVFLVQWIFIRKSYPYLSYIKKTWPFLLSSSVMVFTLIYIGSRIEVSVLALLLLIFVGVIIFAMLSLFISVLIKDDLYMMIKRKRM